MKVTAATRSRARHYTMQAIYQWQLTSKNLATIEAEFHTDNDMSKVDVDYFHEIFHGVAKNKTALDEAYTPFLKGIKLENLDPITMAILRIACFEFKERIDVPYRVVINEAVNIAKKFGAADSHKFVNGILDKVAPTLREPEVKSRKKS